MGQANWSDQKLQGMASTHLWKSLKVDYAKSDSERFAIESCKAVATALLEQIEARHFDDNGIYEILYLLVTGSMMCLMTGMRPDTFLDVGWLSEYKEVTKIALWACIKRISR